MNPQRARLPPSPEAPISWLSPTALFWGLLALPLLALYFLRRRAKRVVVPSVRLWKALEIEAERTRPFGWFRRNLLLLFQLLALLALIAAASRPAVLDEGVPVGATVVVLDTSASMAAVDESPDRLRAAVRRAERLLDALGDQDVMLVLAGARTEVAVPFTRDHASVKAALREARTTEAEGSLVDGLSLAAAMASTRDPAEIVVFSDGADPSLSALQAPGVPVRLEAVGQTGMNAAITALDVRPPAQGGGTPQLFATVEAFGDSPLPASLEVYLDDRPVLVEAHTLVPGSPFPLVVDPLPQAEGTLRVEVHADGDPLPTDDVAWAVLEPSAEITVLLVGVHPLTVRALSVDPQLNLLYVDAASFDPSQLEGVDAAVLRGAPDADLDGFPVLYLHPQAASPLTFGDNVAGLTPTHWDRTHPLVRQVRLEGVHVARASEVVDAAGLTPIVRSGEVPLLLAGRRAGARLVQLTFDPLESDLPLRVAWPVLLLDSVRWLANKSAGEGTATLPTGAPWVWAVGEDADPLSLWARGPQGEVDVRLAGGLAAVRDTLQVGVYEVGGPGGSRVFAANLLSPHESDLTPRESLSFAQGDGASTQLAQAAGVPGLREVWRYLAIFALLALLAEWWVFHSRRSG